MLVVFAVRFYTILMQYKKRMIVDKYCGELLHYYFEGHGESNAFVFGSLHEPLINSGQVVAILQAKCLHYIYIYIYIVG